MGDSAKQGHTLMMVSADVRLSLVKTSFKELTDEQRLEVIADYCKHCGRYDVGMPLGCQCWNDE